MMRPCVISPGASSEAYVPSGRVPANGFGRSNDSRRDQAPRCIHYVGFRDDRYWNAYRIFGGPRVIHRRWDFYATRDVGSDDVVIFAEGDETQPVAERNATDLDERWL